MIFRIISPVLFLSCASWAQTSPAQITVSDDPAAPRVSEKCSIRLLEIRPQAQGKIIVVKPSEPTAKMPEVRMPAPPCPRENTAGPEFKMFRRTPGAPAPDRNAPNR